MAKRTGPGRPQIPKEQHNDRSGFTANQRKMLKAEARKRGVPMAMVVREMADYYFTALGNARSGLGQTSSKESQGGV